MQMVTYSPTEEGSDGGKEKGEGRDVKEREHPWDDKARGKEESAFHEGGIQKGRLIRIHDECPQKREDVDRGEKTVSVCLSYRTVLLSRPPAESREVGTTKEEEEEEVPHSVAGRCRIGVVRLETTPKANKRERMVMDAFSERKVEGRQCRARVGKDTTGIAVRSPHWLTPTPAEGGLLAVEAFSRLPLRWTCHWGYPSGF